MCSRSVTIPFPLARRKTLIVGLAAQMAARPIALAEKHLQQQLRRQADIMRRRGIPVAVIQREVKALELAARAELWRVVLLGPRRPPGAA
jgi:hypothetical protein